MPTLPELLKTPRLILRAPRPGDAACLFDAYTQDDEVTRHMVWRPHQTLLETEAFIAYCMSCWESGAGRPYVLAFHRNQDLPIGMLEARIAQHSIDIGYVLQRACWGQGLMPEAIAALADAALSLPDCFRVQATCHVHNTASARTLEKSGFVREGRLERFAVLPNIGSEPAPAFMYARCR
jgi:RimJ/RimL family protein N-acetyltransferase